MPGRVRKFAMIAGSAAVVLITVIGFASLIAANAGRASAEVTSRWQVAGLRWQQGDVGGALSSALQAYSTSVDAGARYLIADRLMSGVDTLESVGLIDPAVALCNQSVRVMDGYDDHGWQTFECLAIIDRQNSRQCADSCEGVCWSYNRSECSKLREEGE